VAIKHIGTLLPTNSIAEEFYKTLHRLRNQYKLHQSSISIVFRNWIRICIIGFPEVDRNKPPACWILSNALLSTTKFYWKRFCSKGSIKMVSPSLNILMCNWQVGTLSGPPTVDVQRARTANSFATIVVKRYWKISLLIKPSFRI
jgi:hypothetical protein